MTSCNLNWWRLGNLKTKIGDNYIDFCTLIVLSTIAKEIEKLFCNEICN